MASLPMSSARLLLLSFTLLRALPTHSFDFEVGGDEGWTVPTSKDSQTYNKWASKNRFQVGDTIIFKYGKDSVMVVTEKEYDECKSSHPIFFSNNGDTVYNLEQSGLHYFISGIAGHCERGQKMVIKVLSHSDAPGGAPAGGNQTGTPPPPNSPDSSGSVPALVPTILQVFMLLIGSFFF